MGQVVAQSQLRKLLGKLRREKKRIVFTNGCFDLLHLGHVEYLRKARRLGDVLIVGINSDASVKRLKGKARPVLPQKDRALILTALESVDYAVVFPEDTPLRLLKQVKPDILVKGGDYSADNIVGGGLVRSYGGRVKTIPLVKGKSTKLIIDSILRRYGRRRYST